jgi:murein DD-endopeptidase MepM/ murein hydrolase activator NlpD
MVDLLAWRVDFNSDVRPGDHFRVLYQQRVAPDGRHLKPGRILAVEYTGRKSSAEAFLYKTDSGKVTYLNKEGKAVERAFLRYPLEFTRISSNFSYSRFHPILKRRRRHLGVDFAAPTGTPVRSVGAGTVKVSGWQGGLGRAVKIDHGGGLVTVYGHLRRINRGIQRGARVERGQTIGAVGMSGMATGPHLHFAVFDRGRYVNPLRLKAAPTVVKVDLENFESTRDELASRLRTIPGICPLVLSTPPVTLSAVAQAWQFNSVLLTL